MVSFDGAVSSSFVLCLALIDVPPFCTNLKTTYKLYKEAADIGGYSALDQSDLDLFE